MSKEDTPCAPRRRRERRGKQAPAAAVEGAENRTSPTLHPGPSNQLSTPAHPQSSLLLLLRSGPAADLFAFQTFLTNHARAHVVLCTSSLGVSIYKIAGMFFTPKSQRRICISS
ncbi:hypothetical protein LshimejAT787_1401690 [Lyophyllum shimeji]|uniref:Uncharacterized protein n=1 Tax=Lyophyllum shimeji TaxID=47721 RepID=A0A9P3PVF3_LYOSH|nr:hypothetical protein LshimejAT787_1401690 [Lyophyllum shimeji]